MPWITILLFVLSFLTAKRNGATDGQAVLGAALVGGATYAVTHSDFAAGTALAEMDGVQTATQLLDANGAPVTDSSGRPITLPSGATIDNTGKIISTTGEVLKSWGGTGTAAVVGSVALANGAFDKYLPLILLGAGFLVLAK